ncbi:MAG TPA: hypothetical protein VI299_04845 [Polyangiales bacterium]
MNNRCLMAATLGLLWGLSCAPRAHAQDAAPTALRAPENGSVLALSVGPGVVDRDALRKALEAELGVAVQDAGDAPAYMPALSVIALPNGNVEVALSSRTLPRATREFALSAEIPEERVEMVTLIAANLIRNEASALLPELRPAAPSVPVAQPPVTAPPPTLVDPCAPVPPREFGIDLVAGVGASSNQRGRVATRAVSLGLAGTLYDRLQGVELAWTGANIVRKSVCGVQISGGANVSWGPVVGAQLAVFNLVKGTFTGAQLGLTQVAIGDLVGAQLGLVAINHGHLTGAQLGLATYARHGVEGIQGGVLNLALGPITGAQPGVANYVGGELVGAQLGVLNLALGDVDGAQLGVANASAGEVRGIQLGVFNYAERSTASLGVLSIVRRGRTSIDAFGAVDTSLTFLGVTHGGKYIHNVLGVGLRANPNDGRLATVYGIGVRALSQRWLRLDIDVLSQNVYTSDLKHKGVSMVATVRVPVTIMLVRGLGLMLAPSYNFGITDKDETRSLNNFASHSVQRGDPNVRAWPGFTFGLRYQFDHGV